MGSPPLRRYKMAFTVNLYEIRKKENSTEQPSGRGYEIQCDIHEPVNIMKPVFIFNESAPFYHNYLYVQNWERYYWIDTWTYNEGLWEASCTIDTLASWKDSIADMTEYVLRSATDFDSEVVDTTYPLKAETIITRKDMGSWSIPTSPAGGYVVGVVSGHGLTEYYWVTNIASFGAAMFSNDMWDAVVADDPGRQEGSYASFMKAQFNPLQYVTSCMWFPFELPHSTVLEPVYFGYFNSGYSAYKVNRTNYGLFSAAIVIPDHPQIARGKYLNMAPFTRLRLSALPWGEIDLDTTKFANKGSYGQAFLSNRIYLEAYMDPVTGSTKLYVSTSESLILTLVGQIGVPEQLSQVLKDNLATVTGGVSAAAGIVGAIAGGFMGNAGAVANGISTAVSGIGSAVSAQYPDVSSTGTNGARIAVTDVTIRLIATHQLIVDEDRPNRGRPLCQRRRLGSLPGFMIIGDPDVEIPATKDEIQKIKEYMINGFYME